MKTNEYRLYVAGLRSRITPTALAGAKKQLARRRRKKTAASVGKGLAAAAGATAIFIGAVAFARLGRRSTSQPTGPIARR